MSFNERVKSRFGKLLKDLRQMRDWSREDIVTKTGLHRKSIASYERGESMPQLENLTKLASAFGFKASDFLNEIGL